MRFVEMKAKTVDEAVSKALVELNTTKENVEIEILEESKGLFGLLGNKEVKVKVTLVKENESEKAEEFLSNITKMMGMDITFETEYKEEEKKMEIELKGEGLGLLIGRRGETLDAIQYLTNIFLNKETDDYIKVTLDAENYRERRESALVTLAKRTAQKATKYKKNMIIEPKNPYERRIIHEALQDYPGVTTYSIGEEPNRKVVVAYKGMAGTYREN